MTRLTDETLMYYADGLLDPSERRWVEKLVAGDARLQARLEVFQSTGRELADLLEQADNEPAPARLRDFVSRLPVGPEPRRGKAGLKERIFQTANFRPALAASVALVAGIGLGWLLRGEEAGHAMALGDLVRIENNRIVAREPLDHALDSSPSGDRTAAALPDRQPFDLKVKMTFRNEAGRYCRAYEVAMTSSEHYEGVACRVDGQWSVALQALTAPSRPASGQFAPAGGGKSSAMDAAIGALIEGDPLAGEDEAAAMRKGWEK